jgi:hypothetical protein
VAAAIGGAAVAMTEKCRQPKNAGSPSGGAICPILKEHQSVMAFK